jgi:hypothetical protein
MSLMERRCWPASRSQLGLSSQRLAAAAAADDPRRPDGRPLTWFGRHPPRRVRPGSATNHFGWPTCSAQADCRRDECSTPGPKRRRVSARPRLRRLVGRARAWSSSRKLERCELMSAAGGGAESTRCEPATGSRSRARVTSAAGAGRRRGRPGQLRLRVAPLGRE